MLLKRKADRPDANRDNGRKKAKIETVCPAEPQAGLDLSFVRSQGEYNYVALPPSRPQPIGSRKQLEPRSRSAVLRGEHFVS